REIEIRKIRAPACISAQVAEGAWGLQSETGGVVPLVNPADFYFAAGHIVGTRGEIVRLRAAIVFVITIGDVEHEPAACAHDSAELPALDQTIATEGQSNQAIQLEDVRDVVTTRRLIIRGAVVWVGPISGGIGVEASQVTAVIDAPGPRVGGLRLHVMTEPAIQAHDHGVVPGRGACNQIGERAQSRIQARVAGYVSRRPVSEIS